MAMIGLLAAATPPPHALRLRMLLVLLPVVLIVVSVVHAYRGLVIYVASPQKSVVFFGTVQAMPLDVFREAWCACSDANFEWQLLEQVWTNSYVLSRKFAHLHWAFVFTIAAVLPWAISFVILLWADPAAKSLIGR